MNIETFIIGSFAVWRLSHALVKENGPRMWFARLRARAAKRQKRPGGLFDLLSCVRCVSVFMGLVASLWVASTLFNWIGYGFAFSGAAVLLEVLFGKKSDPLSGITRPAGNYEVLVRGSSPPEQGNDVVSNPRTTNGSLAVKAATPLND